MHGHIDIKFNGTLFAFTMTYYTWNHFVCEISFQHRLLKINVSILILVQDCPCHQTE